MIEAIIFDCYGVLVGQGFDDTYRAAGGDPEKDQEFISSILGRANLGQLSRDEFDTEVSEQLETGIEEWREAAKLSEQLNHDLIDYVRELRKSYKVAMLSNANRGSVNRRLGDEIMNNCFDEIIVSAEVGLVKPDPEVYQLAAEKLGIDPSYCVFIDDNKNMVAGAEAVGMHAICYRNLTQLKRDLNELFTSSNSKN